jgi:hypothetical protein
MAVEKKAKAVEIKSFFDIVKVILTKAPYPTDDEINKHTNQYMINMMFSCDEQLAGTAHQMSKARITDRMYFDCLYHGLPKTNKFIKWNAAKAKKEQDVQYLMEYFGCSQLLAKQSEQLIDKSEMDYIRDFFTKRGIVK